MPRTRTYRHGNGDTQVDGVLLLALLVLGAARRDGGAMGMLPPRPASMVPFGIALALVILIVRIAAVRPVRDPNRAIIYRLATLHRVAGPGYVLMFPLVERVEQVLSMGEREMLLSPSGVRTADAHTLKMRLEITWRVHPDVRGRPPQLVRAMLLLPEERRSKLVDEVVTRAVCHVIAGYSLAALAQSLVRDEVIAQAVRAARGDLARRGLWIERIFWRA